MIIPALTHLLSPAGKRARLAVLLFHRVLERPDPLLPGEIDQARFAQLVGWMKEQFTLLEAEDACRRLASGTLPARAAIITFDDGYRDNFQIALPTLQRLKAPAAFFIATGFLEGGAMFNDCVIDAIRRTECREISLPELRLERVPLTSISDRRSAIDTVLTAVKHLPFDERASTVDKILEICRVARPSNLMMNPEEIRALSRAGMEIGGHSRNHPILSLLPSPQARDEILGSRNDLASILDAPPRMFAYPNGRPGLDYRDEHVAMVSDAGFEYAFTTRSKIAGARDHRLELPRIGPWDRTELRFKARMLAWLMKDAV